MPAQRLAVRLEAAFPVESRLGVPSRIRALISILILHCSRPVDIQDLSERLMCPSILPLLPERSPFALQLMLKACVSSEHTRLETHDSHRADRLLQRQIRRRLRNQPFSLDRILEKCSAYPARSPV